MHSSRELVVRLLQAAGAASIVLAALYFVLPQLMIGDGIFVSAMFVFLLAILGWRLAFNQVTGSLRLEERVLFVGTGDTRAQGRAPNPRSARVRLSGHRLHRQRRLPHRPAHRQPGIIGTPDDIDRLVARTPHRPHRRRPVGPARQAADSELLRAKMSGVRVEDATTTYERVTGKILIDDLRPSWLIFSDGFRVSRVDAADEADHRSDARVGARRRRRCRDAADGARRLRSRTAGPCSTARSASARTAATFVLSKFRSMRKDAEKSGTPIWATDDDDRVTRVGRFIRMTRLDELPQLWNVASRRHELRRAAARNGRSSSRSSHGRSRSISSATP